VRQEGGAGAIAILPFLGWIAGLNFGRNWAASAEELSRLTGVNRGSISKARAAFGRLGLAKAEVQNRRGVLLLHWTASPLLLPEPNAERNVEQYDEYFYCSLRLFHGGHWAVLSKVQKAVYLAAATLAIVHTDAPETNYLVRDVLADNAPLSDMLAGYRHAEATRHPVIGHACTRFACASFADLSRVSGYRLTAVKDAVRGFKHPDVWPGCGNDARALEHTPVWVYPTRNGHSLLYHFRDHAAHWPWAVLDAPFGAQREPNELARSLPSVPPLAQR
jgi:hypothetical protein